jgi:hypothetical protein
MAQEHSQNPPEIDPHYGSSQEDQRSITGVGMERVWRGYGGAPMWVGQLSGIVKLTKEMLYRSRVAV